MGFAEAYGSNYENPRTHFDRLGPIFFASGFVRHGLGTTEPNDVGPVRMDIGKVFLPIIFLGNRYSILVLEA